jgi:hypothetical protein
VLAVYLSNYKLGVRIDEKVIDSIENLFALLKMFTNVISSLIILNPES